MIEARVEPVEVGQRGIDDIELRLMVGRSVRLLVTNRETGEAAENVEVNLRSRNGSGWELRGATTTTSAKGVAEFTNVPPGEFAALVFRSDRYMSRTSLVALEGSAGRGDIELPLRLAPAPAIRGRILFPAGVELGQPLIEVGDSRSLSSYEARTKIDAEGHLTITGVSPDKPVLVRVSASSELAWWCAQQEVRAGEQDVEFALSDSVPSGAMRIRTMLESGKRVVAGPQVLVRRGRHVQRAWGQKLTQSLGTTGLWPLAHVSDACWIYFVSPTSNAGALVGPITTSKQGHWPDESLDVVLRPLKRVTGRATNASGSPLALRYVSARVVIEGVISYGRMPTVTALTDTDGSFTMDVLSGVDYEVSVIKRGGERSREFVQLLSAESKIDLRIGRGTQTVDITTVDGEGNPLRGAYVYVVPSGTSKEHVANATSGGDGKATLEIPYNVPPLDLYASYPGGALDMAIVQGWNREPRRLVLPAAQATTGVIVDSKDRPLHRARVWRADDLGRWHLVQEFPRHTWSVALAEGKHRLQARSGHESAPPMGDTGGQWVTAGDEQVSLVLDPGPSLRLQPRGWPKGIAGHGRIAWRTQSGTKSRHVHVSPDTSLIEVYGLDANEEYSLWVVPEATDEDTPPSSCVFLKSARPFDGVQAVDMASARTVAIHAPDFGSKTLRASIQLGSLTVERVSTSLTVTFHGIPVGTWPVRVHVSGETTERTGILDERGTSITLGLPR